LCEEDGFEFGNTESVMLTLDRTSAEELRFIDMSHIIIYISLELRSVYCVLSLRLGVFISLHRVCVLHHNL